MTQLSPSFSLSMIAAIFLQFAIASASAAEIRDSEIELHLAPEDKEVGLKRMEIIDKVLTKDLIERKRELVKEVESDYNGKITTLVHGMISPINKQTVITHVDVNFFATDFKSEVHSTQKVSTSILIKKNGFDSFGDQFSSKQEALEAIKQAVSTTFNIPKEKITVMLVR